MSDFFDQNTGEEEMDNQVMEDAPSIDGPSVRINGSQIPVEAGSNLLSTCKALALDAGFGKFKVYLNGTEIRPSMVRDGVVSSEISADSHIEIRPFDEAG